MRIIITLVLSIALMGCSAKEWEVQEYHETLRQTNNTIVQSIDSQVNHNARNEMDSLRYFSSAMIEAAKTPDPTDGVAIAFAWGYQSSQPDVITIPELTPPAPPVTDVDRVVAWTPIIQMTVPYVAPLIFDGYGNSGTSIRAADQSTVMVGSGNAGSFNQVSGAYGGGIGDSQVLNQHDDLVLYNEGGGDLSNIQPDPVTAQPFVEGEVPGELTEEWCNSQGLTLRESTGECITYEYKSNIENARLVESQGEGGDDE